MLQFSSRRYFAVTLAAICIISSAAYTQTSTIYGTITDKQSGEMLVGANISLVGPTMGAVADLDGKYLIKSVPPGTYSLRISFVGYGTKTVTGVAVKAGASVKIDVDLAPQSVTTDEMVITAERQVATESAILSLRKSSARIGDGFSMEQIKKSPDATSADALRRVTGLSIVDNKFVFVRGVTDRYNSTQLNGVNVTSTDTDVDKKSFSFDMIPAGLLENTMVAKTSTPDLPGDFSGGLVQLNTLSFPDSRVLKFGITGSYNSLATFQTIAKSQGGVGDWMGFDDGSRSFPDVGLDKYALGKSLPNTWGQRRSKAPLNGKLELSYGDRFDYAENQLGIVGALSYGNGYKRSEVSFLYPSLSGSGTIDTYSVLWGIIADLNLKLGGANKISLKNSFNQSADDKLSNLRTVDDAQNDHKTQLTQWSQRSLQVTQLTGSHVVPFFTDMTLDWRASYSTTKAREPDRKTLVYSKNIAQPETEFAKDHTDRSWSDLDEFSRSLQLDIQVPLGDVKVKFGGALEGRERYYKVTFFLPELGFPTTAWDLLNLPPDSIFLPQNFGPGLFQMNTISSKLDEYDGSHKLKAFYAMVDIPFMLFGDRLRFVGGVRLEDSETLVNTLSPFETLSDYTARVKNNDWLPSLNLTYELNPVTNIRLAYSQSVNRPELRELARFYFYDYSIYQGAYGNPLLYRALVRNYDVRFEMFPDVGEVLAASYFYKDISDAIEERIIVSSNPERTWFNSPHGRNYGFELEVRKSLGFLGEYFSNISIVGNYTRIFSDIEYEQGYKVYAGNGVYYDAFETKTREMQGQSPYLVNLSLLFHEPTIGTTVSLLFNEFGERLDAVGDSRTVDIFEQSRNTVDIAITQPVGTSFELKFSGQDIMAKPRRFVTRLGDPHREITPGSNYAFKVTVSL